jgi:hypothetical protein
LTSVGALYVNNSASVLVSGCTFEDTSVSSTFGGGAIYVESEEGSSSAQSSTTQTYLHVSSSTFHRSTAFLGTAIYNSLAIVKFDNSFVAADDGEGDPSNRFFDAAQSATCTSSCGRNQYGNCSLLGTSCASCFIDSCYVSATGCESCPAGRVTTTTALEQQSRSFSTGAFVADESMVPTSSEALQCK